MVARRRAAPVASSCRVFSSTTPAAASPDSSKLNYGVVPKEDFGQYKEYSVIFTNRALNLMSDPFQRVMRDLNELLKTTYNADKVAIIPGYVYVCACLQCMNQTVDCQWPVNNERFSRRTFLFDSLVRLLACDTLTSIFYRSGTFGMESVARQFATNEHV